MSTVMESLVVPLTLPDILYGDVILCSIMHSCILFHCEKLFCAYGCYEEGNADLSLKKEENSL